MVTGAARPIAPVDSELARRLAAGPSHFPHALDLVHDKLLLLELSEAQIEQASFMDQRLVTPDARGAWASLDEVTALSDPAARDDAGWIFHIGHVGSTLISRLLGRLPGVLALREPAVLRQLAEVLERADAVDAPWDPAATPARVAALRRLLARTFRPGQRAIVKATSLVGEIAPELVAPAGRALFLHVSPESFLRTILSGDASREEVAMMTGPRLRRLARRIEPMPYRSWRMGLGERAALGWAVGMLSLAAAEAALAPGAVLWLDFDAFLQDPAMALRRIADHFDLPLSAEEAARLAQDPVTTRYSKAPEHAYSPDLRRRLQAQAAEAHAQSLADGLAWLDTLTLHHAPLARVRAARG